MCTALICKDVHYLQGQSPADSKHYGEHKEAYTQTKDNLHTGHCEFEYFPGQSHKPLILVHFNFWVIYGILCYSPIGS